MRVLIRILSVLLGFSVIQQLALIWRIWRFDGFAALLATRLLGWVTICVWVLLVALGPFAVTQLWRLRESGRRLTLTIAGCDLMYYVSGALFFRSPGVPAAHVLLAAIPAIAVAALLMGPARRAFSE